MPEFRRRPRSLDVIDEEYPLELHPHAAHEQRRLTRQWQVEDVQVSVKILKVWGIDQVNECFNVELRVLSRWRCPKQGLQEARQQIANENIEVDFKPKWTPYYSCWGCVESTEGQWEYFAESEPNGEIFYVGMQWMTMRLIESFQLEDFPFDIQDLNIHLSIDNAKQLVVWDGAWETPAPSPHGTSTLTRTGTPVKPPSTSPQGAKPAVRYIKVVFPNYWLKKVLFREPTGAGHVIHIVALCEHRHSFFRINYIYMLCCIVSCSFFSFAVHWRDVDERLGIDMALLLVAVAFKHELANNTPQISSMTMLDHYAISSIGFLVLATFMHAGLGFVTYDCDALSGDCVLGLGYFIWPWSSSIREDMKEVNGMNQDTHMLAGDLADQICKFSFLFLWVVYNAMYHWDVGHVKKHNQKTLADDRGWSEAMAEARPTGYINQNDNSRKRSCSRACVPRCCTETHAEPGSHGQVKAAGAIEQALIEGVAGSPTQAP
jgi:hypothetical protein